MSGLVETVFDRNQTPWRSEGRSISKNNKLSIKEGIVESGLDWSVGLTDLTTIDQAREVISNAFYSEPDNGMDIPPEIKPDIRHRAVVRSTDQSVLGVVGPRYRPLQNKEAFEWFQPFLDAETCSLHTAGSLHSGRKVWVLAELNKKPSVIVPEDEVSKFILLSNSHDGSTAIRVGFTPIRIWCINMLPTVHKDKSSKLLRVRHTQGLQMNLDAIRSIMDEANATFEAIAEQYRDLAHRQINSRDLERYIKVVLDVSEDEEKVSTRTKNIIGDITNLFETGRGATIPQIRGTWWQAYNGINEYLNHKQGRTVHTRLNSLWFGTGEALNKKALTTALELSV